ncbi:MAG: sialate O-acetylesterase [Woeseiaceae bacterium]|nr:sialate O-acetylesterase [Woeseiaceae bacterium]
MLLFSASTGGETSVYKLYFLSGQSNMVGYGYTRELPGDLSQEVDRVMIFEGRAAFDDDWRGGIGVWKRLEPGHGFGFETDERSVNLSDRFGPELSFGHTLSTQLPDSHIALVKYALGGSGLEPGVGLGGWHPTDKDGHRRNQFDHAMKTLRNALSERDIDGDGVRDLLIPAGIIWMQGESDANENLETAAAYEENLALLVQSIRAALNKPGLPVVIGKITDSGMAEDGSVMDHIERVQQAQAAFAAIDRCAELVHVTDTLHYVGDPWHYDSEGFVRLGEAFADAVLRLEEQCI